MSSQQPQQTTRVLRKPVFTTLSAVEPGSKGHNLVLKVVSSNVVVEKTRTDSSRVKIAEALVGDDTGVIVLTARNNQIEVVQPGQTIIVRNGKVDMYKGFMRLAVDKWGKLEKAPEPATFEVNESNNLSALEYELVNVDE